MPENSPPAMVVDKNGDQQHGSFQVADRESEKPRPEGTPSGRPVDRPANSPTDSSAESSAESSADSSSNDQSRSSAPRRLGKWIEWHITFDQVEEDRLAVFEQATKSGIVFGVYYCHHPRCLQPYRESPHSKRPHLCCSHTEDCGVRRPEKPITTGALCSNFWYG